MKEKKKIRSVVLNNFFRGSYGFKFFFFFFNVPATTEIYTLSLHDALPISRRQVSTHHGGGDLRARSTNRRPHRRRPHAASAVDRKSTRLNSSHRCISYAVFCLKKKMVLISRKANLNDLSSYLEHGKFALSLPDKRLTIVNLC